MAKIKWSHDSIEDLKEICRFIAIDSPYYSNLLSDRIFEMVEHLELFPEMGRHVPESDDLPDSEAYFYCLIDPAHFILLQPPQLFYKPPLIYGKDLGQIDHGVFF